MGCAFRNILIPIFVVKVKYKMLEFSVIGTEKMPLSLFCLLKTYSGPAGAMAEAKSVYQARLMAWVRFPRQTVTIVL